MTNLINELIAEHQSLAASFENLKNLDVTSDDAYLELQSVKSALLMHLKKENNELYPKLKEVALNNPKLRRILDWSMRDMVRVSTALILFFDKYFEGGSNLSFRRDFNRLNTIFKAQSRQEERTIYNEYLNLMVDKAA